MKNQKIRYSGQQSYANAFKALGLVGVALPYTEVVSALQTNMIEGLTNDIFGYTYYDLPRQTRYMLPVPLGFCPQALVVTASGGIPCPKANARPWNSSSRPRTCTSISRTRSSASSSGGMKIRTPSW